MSDVEYLNQAIWETYDSSITDNRIALSICYKIDSYGLHPASLQLSIGNFKRKSLVNAMFAHRHVHAFLNDVESMTKKMQEFLPEIMNDGKVKNLSIKLNRPVKFSIMKKADFNAPLCVRLALSDKETGMSEDEVAFMSYSDFVALMSVFKNFRDEYLSISNNALLATTINTLSNTVNDLNNAVKRSLPKVISMISSSDFKKDDVIEPEIEVPDEVISFQNELDTFVEETKPTIEINFGKEEHLEKIIKNEKVHTPVIEKIETDVFTSRVLEGDASFLEKIIPGMINMPSPLIALLDIVASKMGLTNENVLQKFFPGTSISDVNLLVYCNTRYIKHTLNRHLKDKCILPTTIAPMFAKIVNDDCDKKFTNALVYDLMVYWVYYSLLSSQLAQRTDNTTTNKQWVTFVYKMIAAPLVIPVVNTMNTTPEIIVNEVMSRFKTYKERDVFKELIKSVHGVFNKDIDITDETFKVTLKQVIKSMVSNMDKFEINKLADQVKCKILSREQIAREDISIEQLKQLLQIESFKASNITSDLDDFINQYGDIIVPEEYLSFLNLKSIKITNENLVKFVKEEMKDSPRLDDVLSILTNVSGSYRSLNTDEIDLNVFSDKCLIALSLWDDSISKKILNDYDLFKKKVNDSTFDRSMAISTIVSKIESQPEDYNNCI